MRRTYPKSAYTNLEAQDLLDVTQDLVFVLWHENDLRYAALIRYYESGYDVIIDPSELTSEQEVSEMVTRLAQDGVQILRTPFADMVITMQ